MARQAVDVIELKAVGGTYTFSVAGHAYTLRRSEDLWILEGAVPPPEEELAFTTLGEAVDFVLEQGV